LIFLVQLSWLDYSSGLSVDTHIFKNSEKGLQLMKFYSYLLNNEAKANIYDLVVANVQTFCNQLGIYFLYKKNNTKGCSKSNPFLLKS